MSFPYISCMFQLVVSNFTEIGWCIGEIERRYSMIKRQMGHGDKHSIVTGRRRAKRARPCVVECAFHQRVSSSGFSTVELQSNGSRISTYKLVYGIIISAPATWTTPCVAAKRVAARYVSLQKHSVKPQCYHSKTTRLLTTNYCTWNTCHSVRNRASSNVHFMNECRRTVLARSNCSRMEDEYQHINH